MNINSKSNVITKKIVVKHFRVPASAQTLRRARKAAGFLADFPDQRARQFAAALQVVGLEKIELFDEIVLKIERFLPLYFEQIRALFAYAGIVRSRVSVPFLGELVLVLQYPDVLTEEYLVASGWDAEIARVVVAAVKQSRARFFPINCTDH